MIDATFQRIWYGRSPIALLLWPLSILFASVTAMRRFLYRAGLLKTVHVSKPVIVVGNITVGGTGKTPFVIWLAEQLRIRGAIPGIITRGYGGSSTVWPRDVTAASNAAQMGDEAVLLAQKTRAIVVAGPDRVRAAQRAIELGATVIISDDGLQHCRLARDVEVAVIDEARRFGNGFLLPAGPLREPVRRLRTVDAIVRNCRGQSAADAKSDVIMRTQLKSACAIVTKEERTLSSFAGQAVHAIAGIGNPQAFFDALAAHGLKVNARALADHAQIAPSDLSFSDDAPIFMTEKDAVKCSPFADVRCWSVSLTVEVENSAPLLELIARKLDSAR